MIKKQKWAKAFKVLGVASLVVLPAAAMAASGVDGMSEAGSAAKGLIAAVIKSFQWAIAFLPIWSAWFFSSKMKEYLENKEEQGQYEPKAQKNFKIIAAIVVGVVAAYLLIGIFGTVFLGLEFGESWDKFVLLVWRDLISWS